MLFLTNELRHRSMDGNIIDFDIGAHKPKWTPSQYWCNIKQDQLCCPFNISFTAFRQQEI